jgi:hypothetical protein
MCSLPVMRASRLAGSVTASVTRGPTYPATPVMVRVMAWRWRHSLSEWGHFCQVEARLATIKGMGRKDKGREICINCGQTFHKKLTSKELRCTKCRKAEKKAA